MLPDQNENVILIETINPADLTIDEIWALADDLHEQFPEFKFVPAYEQQHGAGVTWHEVIRIWVENRDVLEKVAFGVILDKVIDAMRERFKKKHNDRRAKRIIIHDRTNGQEIRSILIETSDSDPVEVEISTMKRPLPPERDRGNDR